GPPRRVFAEATAYVVSDILSDRESRSRTFSMESPLSTRFWAAVKTGTSKDMRDNWCIGYSRDYTVGVWTGNFSGESMWNVSGITGAAPVWVEIMNWLHADGAGSASEPRDRSHHFELNGETLGSAGSLLLWRPKQGKYRLLLRDSQGRILDAIEFQVRGGFQH